MAAFAVIGLIYSHSSSLSSSYLGLYRETSGLPNLA